MSSDRWSASEDIQNLKIKRQKRISGDETAKAQTTFYFVDSNSSSREKRAHVMRHHVQKKRRQQRRSYLPWEQKQVELQESADSEPLDVVRSPPGGKAQTSVASSPGSKETRLNPALAPGSSPHAPLPASMPDASRKDTPTSLPTTSSADMELADLWANKLTYWSGQNKYMKDSIFKVSMSHPLAFEAVVLSYCARWKHQISNQGDTTEIDQRLAHVTKGVDDAMQGRLEIDSDSLAMALAGLALQEDRFGSKEQARKYEDRAVQILRVRPRTSNLAVVFLHYVRYVMMPSPPAPVRREDGQDWLVTFLRAADELMVAHNDESFLSSAPHRRTAFQTDSPLFSLLSSGPRPSRVPHDSRIYVVRNVPTQEMTRTAALIYITAALWDFQDSPGKCARFLNYLKNIVKKHELDRYPACETFIWLLLEENCDSDLMDPERAWSTGELLKIHKRLRPDLQFHYNETLFSYLMMTRPIRGAESFENSLSASQMEEVDTQ